MNSTIIAVDLAKSVFEVAVSHFPGRVSETHRLTRAQFVRFFSNREAAVVVLEACGSAHFWARQLRDQGHTVRLLPPYHVRPYVRRNKTDSSDAKALLEAHRNEQIYDVPIKSVAQQTLTALHRIRSAWMADRTARLNLIRGLLRELGYAIPVGARRVIPFAVQLIAAPEAQLLAPLRWALDEVCTEVRELEARIKGVEKQLQALANETPLVERLQTIPGVGLLTATAFVGFVGDAHRFPSGRRFASYLGLTPRERSSGLVRRLGAISKRGDSYLRMLLTHGARSALFSARRLKEPDQLRRWALQIERLRGHNKAAIALANKMARIVWAVWTRDKPFVSRVAA
jgi:transposase